MKLSRRLSTIKNFIKKGSKLADVGTDHALLPIALVLDDISEKVIAMDIKKGPLEKARKNIKAYNLENKIETRLSNGLEKIKKDEIDTVVIAGMGADIIIDILEKFKLKTEVKEYIFSPHTEWEKFRKYLRENSYRIDEEEMILEDSKYYLIIKARYTKEKLENEFENDISDLYGTCLLKNKNLILKEFLIFEFNKKMKLLKNLKDFNTTKLNEKIKVLEKDILKIRKILEKVYEYVI